MPSEVLGPVECCALARLISALSISGADSVGIIRLKVAWGGIGGVGWKLEVIEGVGVMGEWKDVIWRRM